MMRALAVISVIYNHAMIIDRDGKFNPSAQVNFLFLRHWTSIGLDLFFVISGLIMTIVVKSYMKKPSGWFNFFIKRMIRIIPLYWLYSIIVYGERFIIKHPVTGGEIAKTILFFPILAAKNVILPIIGQGWSLTYEMYFYSIIVIFLFLKIKNIFPYLLGLLIALALAGYYLNPPDVLLKFVCTPILIEFALGVAIGVAYNSAVANFQKLNKKLIKRLSVVVGVIGLVLMLSSMNLDSDHISTPFYVITDQHTAMLRSLIWGLPCGLFVLGILFMELLFDINIPKVLIKVGDASFSGYLTHILVILVIGKAFERFNLLNGDVFVIVATLAATVASLPLYTYVEKPLLNISNKLFFKKAH